MIATSIDTRSVLPVLEALKGASAEVRSNANKRLRGAAGDCARGLIAELQGAAASSPTPAARLVAATAKVSSDRVPAVKIGGSRRVGSRKTPAGVLLWGTERGGRTFAAPLGGSGYWIAPTVTRYGSSRAVDVYRAAVTGILADAGVL